MGRSSVNRPAKRRETMRLAKRRPDLRCLFGVKRPRCNAPKIALFLRTYRKGAASFGVSLPDNARRVAERLATHLLAAPDEHAAVGYSAARLTEPAPGQERAPADPYADTSGAKQNGDNADNHAGRKEKVSHRRVCRMYGDAIHGRGEEEGEHVRPGNGKNGGVENAAAEGSARHLRRGRIRRAFPEETLTVFQRPGSVILRGALANRITPQVLSRQRIHTAFLHIVAGKAACAVGKVQAEAGERRRGERAGFGGASPVSVVEGWFWQRAYSSRKTRRTRALARPKARQASGVTVLPLALAKGTS